MVWEHSGNLKIVSWVLSRQSWSNPLGLNQQLFSTFLFIMSHHHPVSFGVGAGVLQTDSVSMEKWLFITFKEV